MDQLEKEGGELLFPVFEGEQDRLCHLVQDDVVITQSSVKPFHDSSR